MGCFYVSVFRKWLSWTSAYLILNRICILSVCSICTMYCHCPINLCILIVLDVLHHPIVDIYLLAFHFRHIPVLSVAFCWRHIYWLCLSITDTSINIVLKPGFYCWHLHWHWLSVAHMYWQVCTTNTWVDIHCYCIQLLTFAFKEVLTFIDSVFLLLAVTHVLTELLLRMHVKPVSV